MFSFLAAAKCRQILTTQQTRFKQDKHVILNHTLNKENGPNYSNKLARDDLLSHMRLLNLKKLLHEIIGPQQNGFVGGRYIGHNIRLLFDVIDYMDAKNKPGAIILLDIYKAFDSLSWPFIFHVFKAYGFGEYLVSWIKILYHNPKCCVTNNNCLSLFFNIRKGVRQGDLYLQPFL